jgi:hypothetical protein
MDTSGQDLTVESRGLEAMAAGFEQMAISDHENSNDLTIVSSDARSHVTGGECCAMKDQLPAQGDPTWP